MKALSDKRVQLAIVGLVVAVAAVYGVAVDQEGLLAIVALLAGAAGGLVGRTMGVLEASPAVDGDDVQRNLLIKGWDQMALEQAKAHENAMGRPFIYPDRDDGDDEDEVLSLAEVVADLSERVTALEARLDEDEVDS